MIGIAGANRRHARNHAFWPALSFGLLPCLAWSALGVAMAPAPLAAQPLQVFSEFARFDEAGKVTAPEFPREILSPAAARNAFNSFQLVVNAPEGTGWRLYVAQNPENSAEVTLYRKEGDRLTKAALPVTGGGTAVFWMDVWIAPDAPTTRIKVEPQLYLNQDWVIYPMEVRIMSARVPPVVGSAAANGRAPVGSASAGEVMRGFLCGTPVEAADSGEGPTVAQMHYRNALQDRALAPLAGRVELQQRFGACDGTPPADNPEWYLPVRDFLFRIE